MDIFINGKKINAYFFDNESTLLKKYAILNKNSIPEFFRITNSNYELKDKIKLDVEDIRQNIVDYTIENLFNDQSVLVRLTNLYNGLSRREIVLLVLINLYGDQDKKFIEADLNLKQKYLKSLDKSFSSISATLEMLDEYKKNIKNKIIELTDFIQKYEEYINSLDNVIHDFPVDCENLFIEEITLDIILDLENGLSLIDVFDAITVSREIPFVYVYYEKKLYSKTYKNMNIPMQWINDLSDVKSRLHFKILNSDEIINEKNISKVYSDGWWDEFNNIEISVNSNLKTSYNTNMQNILFSSIEKRLGDFKIIKNEHSGIRSIFKINNFSFNKVIFADMISNTKIMSFFLFLNEYKTPGKEKVLTATTKNRFMVYFSPGSIDHKNSLSITLTPHISDDKQDEWVVVRISKSKNYTEAETFRKIFCRLLSLYLKDYDSIFKIYEKYLPKKIDEIQKYKKRPKTGGKEDKKTGKRLKELKSQRPHIFRSGYSGMCQPMSHQPYIIPKEKVEVLKKQLGEHKVMEFKDPINQTSDYYACEPREQGEPGTHIFPGLRENTSKNQDYKQSVPDLPCCFTEDQYTKPASRLRKNIQKQTLVQEEENLFDFIEEENINEIGHILGYNKSTPIGRFGQLPYYMNFIIKNAQYEEFEKGKQFIYPIFRYGIFQAPDSFFHCLEKVKNKKYSISTKPDRVKLVYASRENMAKMNLNVLKQEFYDYPEDDIKNILLDKNAYIDPGMWIRLAEEYYKVNIFIFQTSPDFPNGAIVYPRFSKVHLNYQIKNDRESVVIMKNVTENDWPFQCELFAKFNPKVKKGKKINFYFDSNDNFIKEIVKVFNNSNQVYTIYENTKVKYNPIDLNHPLLQKVVKQYIDQNGKTRILNFEGDISMYVPPIPPLNVPSLDVIHNSNLEILFNFMKENYLKIEYYNSYLDESKKVKGIGVKFSDDFIYYGYIFVSPDDKFPKTDIQTINIPDPIRTEKTSSLDLLNKNKKLASILMQHTLFEYSKDPEKFSLDNFLVIEDYQYDVNKLNKLFTKNDILYKNGKLIVQSDEMKNKLFSFLKIQLLNDKPGVMKYKDRLFLRNFYKRPTDFRQEPKQNIFIGFSILKDSIVQKNSKFGIKCSLMPKLREPYFYKNYNISNYTIFLVQNTDDGSLNKALGLCVEWQNKHINIGYNSSIVVDPSSVNYEIYSESGLIKRAKQYTKSHFTVIRFENKYSALLPIE